ncbi:MAG: hypothetical protein J6Q42_04755 [Clostridia bacterium]|nr:hypothetical protein [Clostridia bacterium]
MLLFSFGNFDTKTLVLILLAVLIYLYLRYLDKKEKSSTSAALCKRYATLTEDTLTALSDEELLPAVIANLLAKANRRQPDIYIHAAAWSHGRVAVYSVWLLCRELETADFEKIPAPSRRFAELAVNGFELLGAANCAEALRALVTAFADSTVTAEFSTALRTAIAKEKPLALCTAYIRENITEFCDL